MILRGVGILCLQETHLTGASHFEEDGFSFFLSGATSGDARSYAGVGFAVAPWAANAIVSFKAISDRVASLRVKVTGGILTLITVYIPHDGHSLDERQAAFADLSKATGTRTSHTSTLILGDFNAQLGDTEPGEEEVVGPFVFKKQLRTKNIITNRELLLEFCMTHRSVLANTFFDYP